MKRLMKSTGNRKMSKLE